MDGCNASRQADAFKALTPETGQMSARTDALVSQPEAGKMTASIVPIAAGCHPA